VPDFLHCKIQGKDVLKTISDRTWLENDFIKQVQQRGAKIIEARGKSSAASAANAVVDTVRSICQVTPREDFYSLGCFSKDNSYGIDEDLIFSFPCRTLNGKIEIVSDLNWDHFLREKIKASEQELIQEREMGLHGTR
jgi:malate/lactate dehydrogenase